LIAQGSLATPFDPVLADPKPTMRGPPEHPTTFENVGVSGLPPLTVSLPNLGK
jgi:hypothetical protein